MSTSIRRVRTPIGQVQLVDDGKTTDRPIDVDELKEGNGHPLEVERDIASVVEGAAATTDRDQDADMDAEMEYRTQCHIFITVDCGLISVSSHSCHHESFRSPLTSESPSSSARTPLPLTLPSHASSWPSLHSNRLLPHPVLFQSRESPSPPRS